MKNTNTNPHAGIDYIMPGEEEDCGIEEVTEIEVHPLLDLMSKHLEEMERATWPDEKMSGKQQAWLYDASKQYQQQDIG